MTWNLSVRRTRNGAGRLYLDRLFAWLDRQRAAPRRTATVSINEASRPARRLASPMNRSPASTREDASVDRSGPPQHRGHPTAQATSAAVVAAGSDSEVHVGRSTDTALSPLDAPTDSRPTSSNASLAFPPTSTAMATTSWSASSADGPTSQHIEVRQPVGNGYGEPVDGLALGFGHRGRDLRQRAR